MHSEWSGYWGIGLVFDIACGEGWDLEFEMGGYSCEDFGVFELWNLKVGGVGVLYKLDCSVIDGRGREEDRKPPFVCVCV